MAANRLAGLASAAQRCAPGAVLSPGAPPPGSPRVVLRAEGMALRTPDGRLLLENVNLELSQGQRLLVVMPPLAGKSVPLGGKWTWHGDVQLYGSHADALRLVRALAGLWSYMSGSLGPQTGHKSA